ncbi:hypothetical protein DET54_11931 [Paenibacillus pabuli]|uniref:Uncharacterized protein n=1 Tax=Paenibacillus pabuli TaxID=1472 RepID=A0A855YE35_9BACL|nr:hypothetical protein DET56_101637 [Paenibacillus pabuli]PXW11765.1 hypothetical protein DEU73_101636 [Paenibacillus taichungensis]RAI86088.1 hypothetical protein DET54_11931 [Paenibacillus pabuli]
MVLQPPMGSYEQKVQQKECLRYGILSLAEQNPGSKESGILVVVSTFTD